MPLQHTIRTSASLEGIGLHTGANAKVTVNPADDDFGIRFVRSDIANSPQIAADIDNVVDLARGTTIGVGDGNVRIATIEHLMSAFAGLEIDNCLVEVDAPELPLMDGSALPFVKMIQKAGIVEQTAQREFITLDEPVDLVQGDLAMGMYPADHLRITVQIDYHHPALGVQYTTMFNVADFISDFAPSRTFCFLSEIEALRERGLIKGGSLSSALVVQDVELTKEHIDYMRRLFDEKGVIKSGTTGFLNNETPRFYNEPCRHKALDLLGDLYLLGKPIKAHIFAARPGHASNHEIAKKLRAHLNKKKNRKTEKPPVSYDQIMDLLPHRYPFLLVDGVEKIESEKSIVAFKHVSFNDHFFQGHFPGNPIMPGVLQIEAMAQAGGIMSLFGKKVAKDATILFLAADKVRWRGIVRPGDKLRIECEMLQNRRNTIRFAGRCYVGDTLVSEAELMAMLGKKEDLQ